MDAQATAKAADSSVQFCEGSANCQLGGQLTLLHMAVIKGSLSCTQELLSQGGDPTLQLCFEMTFEEEPDWDEVSEQFVGGCSNFSPLDFAVTRGDVESCRILLKYGAEWKFDCPAPTQLESITGLLCRDEDGETIECSICYESILLCVAQETLCKHVFHRRCLSKLQANLCPLCRCKLD